MMSNQHSNAELRNYHFDKVIFYYSFKLNCMDIKFEDISRIL